jgi:hypothetical protein
MTRSIAVELKRIASASEEASEGLLKRTFRRFRLPRREKSTIEQTAARNRAERLFAVNFRTTWTR